MKTQRGEDMKESVFCHPDVLGPAAARGCSAATSVATARGESETAIGYLRPAIAGFEKAEMALHREAARRRLGQHLGGDEGRALVASSEAWMTAQGIKKPERMTAMLAPVEPR